MRKFLLMLLALGLVLLAACGSSDSDTDTTDTDAGEDAAETTEGTGSSEAGDDTVYQIGASQFVEHPSLDAAYEGFMQALEDAGINAEYDLQSAQADQNNIKPISDGFVADGVDLIFANSTPSALGAINATSDIPVVFTSVTDAVDAGLVESMEAPGGNATGVVDLHPEGIQNTVQFIADYFPGATIGTVYSAGEQNSVRQVDVVKEEAEKLGLSVIERTVANTGEVQQSATTLVEDIDVFYIITDNTVVSALESVVGVANDYDIPLVVGEPDSLARGGFATFGIDYFTIGYRSGELAVEILTEGKDPSEIPAEYPSEIQLFINKTAVEEQGIEWNSDWDEAEIME